MLGYFNANLIDKEGRRKSTFTEYLKTFVRNGQYVISDEMLLPSNSFTYVSYAWNTTSWLDHCVTTIAGQNCIKSINILYNFISSDHKPLHIEIDFKNVPKASKGYKEGATKINWKKMKYEKIHEYKEITGILLDDIILPKDLLCCKDMNCNSTKCKEQIDELHDNIISCLNTASEYTFNKNSVEPKKSNAVPGWNIYVKESHALAREAFITWKEAGKPRTGMLAETMRRTRLHFKYSLRFCRRKKNLHTSNAIAEKLLSKNSGDFWKEIKRVKKQKPISATTINGETDEQNITDIWRNHYSAIFSSVPSATNNLPYLEDIKIEDYEPFAFNDVHNAIESLNTGKACDHMGISVEHIKNANDKVTMLITLCLNSMMIHGYLPSLFMQSVITPIVKNKNGDISDTANYRPITIASTLSKVIEKLLLERILKVINLSSNQFGFKKKHSTDMCNFILKETVRHYRSLGSNVFACFLDASKAFDRVNHRKLFNILHERKIPSIIIRIIRYWYSNQTIRVRWGSFLSELFNVKNGVRQGGVLSPILFNIYVDSISIELNKQKVGCMIGRQLLNHLFFADDLVIIAPSHKALQKLVNVCNHIGIELDIKFNELKTMCMVFRVKNYISFVFEPILLNGKPLKYCESFRYLGHVINDKLNDNEDIMRQTSSIYARGNMLINTFNFCTDNVKCMLFNTYISNFYMTYLWCTYNNEPFHKFRMAYNNTFRTLFKLDRLCSISGELHLRRLYTCEELQQKLLYRFFIRVYMSKNDIMSAIVNSDISTRNEIFKKMYKVVNQR